MDLGTIRRKLDTGQYTNPWEYVNDVWLMFDNAWLYNKKTSRVYKYCTKVLIVGSFLFILIDLMGGWLKTYTTVLSNGALDPTGS